MRHWIKRIGPMILALEYLYGGDWCSLSMAVEQGKWFIGRCVIILEVLGGFIRKRVQEVDRTIRKRIVVVTINAYSRQSDP